MFFGHLGRLEFERQIHSVHLGRLSMVPIAILGVAVVLFIAI